MIFRLLISLILTISSTYLFAQILDDEQANSNIKWKQINHENFRLIFPEEYSQQASILSNRLIKIQPEVNRDLRSNPRKIPIILQANHIIQNGFVRLAPWKTEFFALPSGVSDNTEWLSNLAIHELRHVSQMDKLTGNFKAPFLEEAALALFGIHLPAWFFEGDAVSIETQFSNGGRGRMPSWFMPLRTNELSERSYTFDKNILGSFKDITPTYYTTGYLMNTHLSNNFGYEIKEKILEDMRGKLLRPFNFYRALHRNTNGLNSRKLYRQSIDSLSKIWKHEAENKSIYAHIETPKIKYPSHYLLPQFANENLYAIQRTPQKINQIISLKDGKATHIAYTGGQLQPYFHANKNLIVWDEVRKHPRFSKDTYNVINLFDVENNKQQTIALENFVYDPSLSQDNQKIVYTQVDKQGKSSLTVYDITKAEIIQEIKLPIGLHIQQPKFNDSANRVICIAISQEGTTLIEFDLINNSYQLILPWGNQELERPSYAQQQIIYKAHYVGTDNIYILDKDSKQVFEITNTKFGAFNPSLHGRDSILFNDYSVDGYKIAQEKIKHDKVMAIQHVKDLSYDNHLSSNRKLDLNVDTNSSLEIKPYNMNVGFLNFHSLSLSSNNFANFNNVNPGIFWLANDVLNTSYTKLGYEYNTDTRKSIYSAEVGYSKYLPKFTVKYENRGQVGQGMRSDSTTVRFDWREHYTTAQVELPFSIYRQEQVYSYGLLFGTSYQQRYDVTVTDIKNFVDKITFPMSYIAYFNKNKRRAAMDLQPQWGQSISLTFRHVPFADNLKGRMLSIRTNFYLPGLALNHGLQVRLSWQDKNGRYIHSNDIPTVSGFGYFDSPRVENTLLLNYRFPVAYPDWTIGPLAYVKRIQAQVFTDYQNIQNSSMTPKTIGIGVSADLNALRYVLPDINVGTRLMYINDTSTRQKLVPTFSLSYSY